MEKVVVRILFQTSDELGESFVKREANLKF